MTSESINQYLNDNTKGKERDYQIECSKNQYGVISIIIRANEIPCSCCKESFKRKELISKRWTDGQGYKRDARMCQSCSAIAKDLYNI